MNLVGENLKKVRLLKNLSLRDAGKLLNLSPTAVSKYEKGLIVPDSTKLIEFANAYQVKTLEFLKENKRVNMQFASFRKKKRLSGKKLELLKNVIEEEVFKYLDVLELNSFENKPKLKKYPCRSLEDAEACANMFRSDMLFSLYQPLSDLVNMLENIGVVILTIKNYASMFDDFDGLSEYVNDIPFIVLLGDIKDGARQRFTIAHELGHLVLNVDCQDIDEEKLCHRFASALLMPKDAVIREFGNSRLNIGFGELEAFKQEYKVSYAAIVYRLKDLGIINDYLYKRLSIQINKRIGKHDPYPIPVEKSYQFQRLVCKLEASNIISLNKACEYLGVNINEYNNQDYYYGY